MKYVISKLVLLTADENKSKNLYGSLADKVFSEPPFLSYMFSKGIKEAPHKRSLNKDGTWYITMNGMRFEYLGITKDNMAQYLMSWYLPKKLSRKQTSMILSKY